VCWCWCPHMHARTHAHTCTSDLLPEQGIAYTRWRWCKAGAGKTHPRCLREARVEQRTGWGCCWVKSGRQGLQREEKKQSEERDGTCEVVACRDSRGYFAHDRRAGRGRGGDPCRQHTGRQQTVESTSPLASQQHIDPCVCLMLDECLSFFLAPLPPEDHKVMHTKARETRTDERLVFHVLFLQQLGVLRDIVWFVPDAEG
jgi:hypothetical protein